MLFEEKGVRIDRIKLVIYSVSDISRLINTQIQNIIDYMNDKTVINGNNQSHVTLTTIIIGNDQSHDLLSVIPQASVLLASIPKINLTYDWSYFYNKILDQYFNLYREFSSKNFDYYGIINEKICPLCELEHDEEESLEGRYKAGSYFIKCEQCEIEITA